MISQKYSRKSVYHLKPIILGLRFEPLPLKKQNRGKTKVSLLHLWWRCNLASFMRYCFVFPLSLIDACFKMSLGTPRLPHVFLQESTIRPHLKKGLSTSTIVFIFNIMSLQFATGAPKSPFKVSTTQSQSPCTRFSPASSVGEFLSLNTLPLVGSFGQ